MYFLENQCVTRLDIVSYLSHGPDEENGDNDDDADDDNDGSPFGDDDDEGGSKGSAL